jgi:hypothetical protein
MRETAPSRQGHSWQFREKTIQAAARIDIVLTDLALLILGGAAGIVGMYRAKLSRGLE